MKAHKIPASVIMAQAILESSCGKMRSAKSMNNHFGMEAGADWKGKRSVPGKGETKIFRWYNSANESFQDNSQFLLQKPYEFLFTVPMTDYEYWCRGLRVIKFSVKSDYDTRLIAVIKQFKLDTLVSKNAKGLEDANLSDDIMEMSLDLFPGKMDIPSFIERVKDMAVLEMQEYGMPASVILAQAILESACGMSPLSAQANNFFGIKCNGWNGETFTHMDDCFDKDGAKIPCCFRKYESPFESFRDHSKFLRKPRYLNLFSLKNNFEAWCYGLQVAGYATDPGYARRLIKLINENQLYEHDK
jgi:flagellum-specific peptidoglycan hydrolase FlgJ